MKKLIYIALASVIAFTSCKGFLDREPSTALPEEGLITTAADIEKAINGIAYIFTVDRFSYASEFGIYADLLTNEFAIIDNYGQTSSISKYNMTSTDELAIKGYAFWYMAIAEANKALEASKDMTDVDNLRGQLYAWRALCHFDLARAFCHIPATMTEAETEAANSGIVISDQVFEPEFKPTRATLKKTYEQIIEDFTTAIGLLDDENPLGYIGKYAAIALRARAYLYMGKYAEALADANDVIDNSGKELYEIADYVAAWSAQGTKESLFEILINEQYNPQRYAMGYYTDAEGYPECGFNESGYLYTYLSTNPDDIRSKLIKDQTDADYGYAAGYYPNKYPGQSGSTVPLYANNPKIIRLSEVYLIAAEASFYSANDGGATAAGYINAINEKRITGYSNVASVTIDDIIKAYTIEMFCENQIAFAYWRNKKSVINQLGQTIGYDHNRSIMPIPQREIHINPDGLVQNPGY